MFTTETIGISDFIITMYVGHAYNVVYAKVWVLLILLVLVLLLLRVLANPFFRGYPGTYPLFCHGSDLTPGQLGRGNNCGCHLLTNLILISRRATWAGKQLWVSVANKPYPDNKPFQIIDLPSHLPGYPASHI